MSIEVSDPTSTAAIAQGSVTNQAQAPKQQVPSSTDSFIASKPKNDLALYGKGGKQFGAAGQIVNSDAMAEIDTQSADDEMEASRIHQQRVMYEVHSVDLDAKRMQHDIEIALMDAERIQQEV